MNQVDVSVITDITALKAMAYDQIAAKERATASLDVVNARISQLLNDAAKAPLTEPNKPGVDAAVDEIEKADASNV